LDFLNAGKHLYYLEERWSQQKYITQ
jgi:hypothetical protein